MREERLTDARAWLAVLILSVLSVSASGQAAPTGAQTPPPPATAPATSQAAPQTPPGQTPAPPTSPAQTQPLPPATSVPAAQAPAPASDAPPIQEQRTPGPTRNLTLEDAVQAALEQNLGLQVQRINPQISDIAIDSVRAAWLPNLTGNANLSNSTSQATQAVDVGTEAVDISVDRFSSTFGISQRLPWLGTEYTIGMDNSRLESNSRNNLFNPQLDSSLSFRVTQPLLADFQIDSARASLLVSRKNREIADVALRQQIVQTMRTVRNAYWDLVFARANLGVAQQSLDLARQTLRDNRTRVEVGTMAPIDIVQAEAEVATNEENTIVAAAGIDEAEDNLRALIYDPSTPDFWNANIDTADAPPVQTAPSDVDVETAVKNAIANRTDLVQARKALEADDINLRLYRNQILPTLDFVADYGLAGFGGDLLRRLPDGSTEVEQARSFGDALNSLFGRDNPSWAIGVQFAYPLGKSSQEAQLARAKLEYKQTELGLRNSELSVATEVRSVGRNVNTNRRRVQATSAARILSERRLEAEQKKFAVGLSTNFQVFQAQRDLAAARNDELRARIDYVKSLVDFDAVQQAGTGGSSGNLPSGGNTGGSPGAGGR